MVQPGQHCVFTAVLVSINKHIVILQLHNTFGQCFTQHFFFHNQNHKENCTTYGKLRRQTLLSTEGNVT